MTTKRLTITGGNGYVGRVLQPGLRRCGYQLDVFDKRRGLLADLMGRYYLGTATGRVSRAISRRLRRGLLRADGALMKAGLVRPSWDDIFELRSRLADRFKGSAAVIHLAALPHPKVPGAGESDYRRINYEAAINVFEAARAAGVPRFIFASSAQVYGINKPVRIDQFPILETNYCPTPADGQNMYGWLKREFEDYLARACGQPGGTQAISLRLEYPGLRSRWKGNFYISTSVENTVAGFVAALETEWGTGYDVFNLADRVVDERTVNIQEFLAKQWPDVPNHTTGNECLLSTEKARALLKYNPQPGGTYFSSDLLW